MEYESGQKIQYQLFDKHGKGHWIDGVIHAVRRYEDPETNRMIKVTYLVDTGRDLRVDEYKTDPRDVEISKRINKLLKNGKPLDQAVEEVKGHTDLPKSEPTVERVRQPEQLELPAQNIRAA